MMHQIVVSNGKKLCALVCVSMSAWLIACAAILPHDGVPRDDSHSVDDLKAGFANPPHEAKPRVWWHWMNGNISQDGIQKDLEWMQRVGIGGLQNFDAAMKTPVVVDERLSYMSQPWKDAFRFAVDTADALDLEVAIASSAGWSLTGGPWVKPEDAMKKLVWSETLLAGGGAVELPLPNPSSAVGPFQQLPASYHHGHNEEAIPERFYRDALVLAYPVATDGAAQKPLSVKLNKNTDNDALALLSDGDWLSGVSIPKTSGETLGSVELTFGEEQRIQSASVFVHNVPDDFMQGKYQPTLQALVKGEWQTITRVALRTVPTTISFSPVTAKQFRLLFTRDKPSSIFQFTPAPGIDPSSLFGMGAMATGKTEPLLTDFRLFSQAKVNDYEVKAGFSLVADYHSLDDAGLENVAGVKPDSVLNITEYMNADGLLQWQAPAGSWKVLRLGYSLTGKTNSPATDEATGLEVDKYDAEAVTRYMQNYLGMYEGILGDDLIGERGLQALLTDSTEVGPSNWTPSILQHFQRLRGYDAMPWLPALTGEVVGSRAQSDAFLYDFRHTLAELSAEQHYETIASFAEENGLTLYGESLEGNRLVSTLGDDLEMRRFADIPMAAMWSFPLGQEPLPHYIADMRGAASVAHIYGQNLAAAESLTSILQPWAHAPSDLQPMIDAEFLQGINRPVIHTSPHQPVDDKVPGLSLHVFGQYFTRHETWAEMAKPWMEYIARNSYLLQQGRFVADVAYFYGEEPPIGVIAGTQGYPTDVPEHYAYDFLPPDALLNELYVEQGRLKSKGGASYRVLFLGESSRRFMTLPVLQKIEQLVEQGATVVGIAPERSPSLADDPLAFDKLVAKLWNGMPVNQLGNGQLIASSDVEKIMATLNIGFDFDVPDDDGTVQFVHRKVGDADIYFVANRGEARQFDAQFRVVGKEAEIWRADSGTTAPASYRISADYTTVLLSLEAWESVFVVFHGKAASTTKQVKETLWAPALAIESPWAVEFQAGRGAPTAVELSQLVSLSEHSDPGIRYFSGVASYNTRIHWAGAKASTVIDLGEVGDIAEVYINGTYAGTAWKAPYRVDITKHLHAGDNDIEIRVANRWVNRLIGDRQPGDQKNDPKKITYTTFNTYMPNAPLQASGLIGPVQLLTAE